MTLRQPQVSALLAVELAAVCEDAVNQLAILGALDAKVPQQTLVADELASIVQEQRDLEMRYDKLLAQRETLRRAESARDLEDNDAALKEVAAQLKASTALLCKSLQHKPGTAGDTMKVQGERRFAQDLLSETTAELLRTGTFTTLTSTLQMENNKRAAVADTVTRERETRLEVKRLKAAIEKVKQELEADIQEKNELVAQLKDQRQETRVRTQMERSYVEHDSKMQLQVARKQRDMDRQALEAAVAELHQKMEQEASAHTEILNFLRDSNDDLTKKLEEWNSKYEKETEAKQQELEALKAARAADLNKLQELTEMYKEYEKVCVQDRKRKRKMKEAAEKAIKELAAAIRIQAWWRGHLVRRRANEPKPVAATKKKKAAGGNGGGGEK